MPEQPQTAPPRLLPPLLRGALVGLVLAFALEVVHIYLGGNFREVIPGSVYRCSQPGPGRLESLVRGYGIRTVVNLRGVCAAAGWYRDESRALGRLGVSQEDVGFSAGRMPSSDTIRRLVEIIDNSEYPILFHCQMGVDRTGMAVVLTLLLHTDQPFADARRHLGLRFGHVPLGRTAYLDRFFDLYEEWLEGEGREHTPATFRRWVLAEYCPAEGRAAIEPLEPAGRPGVLKAGHAAGVRVRCTNTSVRPWHMNSTTNGGVHALWRLQTPDGHAVGGGRAGLFDAVVPPGAHVDLTLPLPRLTPGRYLLWVDLLSVEHATFVQLGSEPLAWWLEVS